MKLRYSHFRMVNGQDGYSRYEWKEMGILPDARGGVTVCTLFLEDGGSVEGIAICSEKDNYSKKLGRQIARGRALKKWERGEIDYLEEEAARELPRELMTV